MRLLLLLAALPCLLAAQVPRVGIIDFYGLNRVPMKDVLKALELREGDPLPPSKGAVEERLELLDNVAWARLEAACCEGDRAILYVGIEEKGAPHFSYLTAPTGEARLPEELIDIYRDFLAAYRAAVQQGDKKEDLRSGHSLMDNLECRRQQMRFLEPAETGTALLKEVLRTSSDPLHRTVAAYALGYAPKKKEIVNDLQAALRDPQDSVRYNALRALTAVLLLGQHRPEVGIPVEVTWLVEMLHSIVWTDRRNAAMALVELTESRNPRVLDQLRDRALPELMVMARWKNLEHALPAYMLAARTSGMGEKELLEAWINGRREEVLERIENALRKSD